MTRNFSRTVLAVCMSTVPFLSPGIVQAKQQCSAAPPDQHGYWSWRLIDGRKCWYEGKPMLSKSLLEWPAQTTAEPDSGGKSTETVTETRSDPLDAQASVPAAFGTFEAMWRDRIEQH